MRLSDHCRTESGDRNDLMDKIEIIKKAREIVGWGRIAECMKHQSLQECNCWEFDNNFITLLPGEREALRVGDTSGWEWSSRDSGDTLICSRHGVDCTNKPIDCAIYPFNPIEVNGKTVTMASGLNTCPLGRDPEFMSKITAINYILPGSPYWEFF